MTFNDKIQKFNAMYALPRPAKPSLTEVGNWQTRIQQFQAILGEELEEGTDIIEGTSLPLNILTELSDWLGDIIVYAWSEAARYGISINKTQKFNAMTALPHPVKPSLTEVGNWQKRIRQFQAILREELERGTDIIKGTTLPLNILTELSDWLEDIVVYAWSEAARYGIPIEKVLDVIMESNFSKLDEDGQPIKDERNKVLKGPLYWAPEDKIRKLLQEQGA